jgi:hypothetical protein
MAAKKCKPQQSQAQQTFQAFEIFFFGRKLFFFFIKTKLNLKSIVLENVATEKW